MADLYILVPGTGRRWFSGGLLTHLRLAEALGPSHGAEVLTYIDREPAHRFLDDVRDGDALYVGGFGPHVAELVERLAGLHFAYWANSFGWQHRPPAGVPILAASQFTLGLWGEDAPGSPIFRLPNILSDEFYATDEHRDIDVLHVGRKSSAYLRERLLPALTARFAVTDVSTHVPDLASLFRRSKVYVYDSRDHWTSAGVSEGFGLQPLEAMACGCTVFSSVNAGLADFIDPGFTAEKIGAYSLDADVARVAHRLTEPVRVHEALLDQYRVPAVRERWNALEPLLREHFRFADAGPSDVRHDNVGWRTYGPPATPVTSRWRGLVRRTLPTPVARRLRGLRAGRADSA